MDYKKIYDKIIERSKTRILGESYYEKHHIIPRCVGGSDDKENLCYLTPEEHYLVHQLLVKINPTNQKLLYAVRMMCIHNSNKRMTNKEFGWVRRKLSENISEHFKQMWGKYSKEEYETRCENMKWDEERYSNHSEYMKQRYENQEYYDKFVETMTAVNKDVSKRKTAGKKIKDKWNTLEFREKNIKSRIGIVWWTNGIDTMKSKESPGDNWYRGRSNKNLGRKSNETN
jgi:hypothetical protein